MTRPKVIVVDDSKSTRQTLKVIMVKLGAEVFEAENGQQALDLIATNKDEIKLIFCDIEMPVMDGLEFVRILDEKTKAGEARIPTVMLTALGQREIILKARTFGIKGYILKPANVVDITKIYAHYVDNTIDTSNLE